MAANYPLTSDTEVFPSAYRDRDLKGKFTSEANFTNIIKSLSDVDSFVIDWKIGGVSSDVTDGTTAGTLEVIIDGYYFCLKNYKLPTNCTLSIKRSADYLINYRDNVTQPLDVLGVDWRFYGIAENDNPLSADAISLEVSKGGRIINKGHIKAFTDADGNWLDLNAIFKNWTGATVGGQSWPIYYDENDGFKEISIDNIGSRPETIPGSYQNIYIKDKQFLAGQKITVSTVAPTAGSDPTAKVGDLWFVVGN